MRKKTKRIGLWVMCLFGGFVLGASAAFADTLDAAARAVIESVKAGDYTIAVVMGLVAAVAALRKFGGKRWPFLASDIGGGVLVLVAAFGTTLAASLQGGEPLSVSLVWQSLKLAAMASGGYTLVKRLGGLLLRKLPIPGWAESALSAALWLFQPRGSEAIAKADQAGQEAVNENPGTGSGPTGTLK